MSILSIMAVAIGVAMDATVVALTLGIRSCPEKKVNTAIKAGLYFGFFQGLMPFIGWLLGKNFTNYIISIDHWIAFAILALIGGKMVADGSNGQQEQSCIISFSHKLYLTLAIATSIDALALGLSFAFLKVNIVNSVLIIGIVTFVFSFLAVITGERVGNLFRSKATVFGGIILIGIGSKILLEHLEVKEAVLSLISSL